MSWLDSAIEKASNPISVNVSDLGLDIDTIEVKPLSAAEFQTIKSFPEIAKLHGTDKNEVLGLRTVYEMIAKCDDSISWAKFNNLPLNLLAELATRVTEAVGTSGGGALGEA